MREKERIFRYLVQNLEVSATFHYGSTQVCMHRFLILAALLPTAPLSAQALLKDADREALLDQLDRLRDAAEAKVDARFRVAVAAYRSALASETATMELYLKCVEKVQFEDQHRKAQDFREWKRRHAEEMGNPARKAALRHQLNWLLLSLEAASAKGNLSSLRPRVESALDAIFSDAAKLKGGHGILREGATGSVFARAYEIGGLRIERWPAAPGSISEIFDAVLMPPHRKPDSVNKLRSLWQKRIQYESLAAEHWGEEREGTRVGTRDAMRTPDYERFLAETLPDLQWQMEEDLFKAGDEQGAASRMLAHIEKNVTHKKATEWANSFRKLIDPEKEEDVPRTGGTAPATAATGGE